MSSDMGTRPVSASCPAERGAVLEVRGLSVEVATDSGWKEVIDDVNFTVGRDEVVGIVGESGSGKSLTSRAIMGALPGASTRITAGTVRLDGRNLTELSQRELEDVRGRDVAMVLQEPMTSLNPSLTIGDQVAEVVRRHRGATRAQGRAVAVDVLGRVGIPNPRRRLRSYPHEFSGGMRQRVAIAMALACDPMLLIADEPTTALDVTIQAQVLDLLRSISDERSMSVLFITHDLGVIANLCDRVVVMYAGQIVEEASTVDLFRSPRHPYTASLIRAMPTMSSSHSRHVIPGQPPFPGEFAPGCRFEPRCAHAEHRCAETAIALTTVGHGRQARCRRVDELDLSVAEPPISQVALRARSGGTAAPTSPSAATASQPLIEARRLRVEFRARGRRLRAVRDVDLTIGPGETLGLVGESGSGKSTTGRALLRLLPLSAGDVLLDGRSIATLSRRQLRPLRAEMQMVFQDPYSSLDPSSVIADIVAEPLRVHRTLRGAARHRIVGDLLERVGLDHRHLERYPHEFSGGQRQRIAIARAIALDPKLVVLDEAVSALDVSTQNQVLDLLTTLRQDLGLSYLFISHNLAVVRGMADRVAVMYLGRIVEAGPTGAVFDHPSHPYTRGLIAAVPEPAPIAPAGRRQPLVHGDVADPLTPPPGCPFHPRCPDAMPVCSEVAPVTVTVGSGTPGSGTPGSDTLGPGHSVACHLHGSGPASAGDER